MTDKFSLQVPKNVLTITSGTETRIFEFKDLILWCLNTDTRFNQDGPGIKSSIRIERALEESDSELILRVEDHSRLVDALTTPLQLNGGKGYPLTPARILAPWIDAVEKALLKE